MSNSDAQNWKSWEHYLRKAQITSYVFVVTIGSSLILFPWFPILVDYLGYWFLFCIFILSFNWLFLYKAKKSLRK